MLSVHMWWYFRPAYVRHSSVPVPAGSGRYNYYGDLSLIEWGTMKYRESYISKITHTHIRENFLLCCTQNSTFSSKLQDAILRACLFARKWAKVRKCGSIIAHFPIYPNTEKEKWENHFSFSLFPFTQSLLASRVL